MKVKNLKKKLFHQFNRKKLSRKMKKKFYYLDIPMHKYKILSIVQKLNGVWHVHVTPRNYVAEKINIQITTGFNICD